MTEAKPILRIDLAIVFNTATVVNFLQENGLSELDRVENSFLILIFQESLW